MSTVEKGKTFEKIAIELFKNNILNINYEEQLKVDIGFKSKKSHKFDFGSFTHKILIECKAFTYTEKGNNPSAKISTIKEAILDLFLAGVDYKKHILLLKSKNPKTNETLAEYFVRLNKHLLFEELNIWEIDSETQTISKIH